MLLFVFLCLIPSVLFLDQKVNVSASYARLGTVSKICYCSYISLAPFMRVLLWIFLLSRSWGHLCFEYTSIVFIVVSKAVRLQTATDLHLFCLIPAGGQAAGFFQGSSCSRGFGCDVSQESHWSRKLSQVSGMQILWTVFIEWDADPPAFFSWLHQVELLLVATLARMSWKGVGKTEGGQVCESLFAHLRACLCACVRASLILMQDVHGYAAEYRWASDTSEQGNLSKYRHVCAFAFANVRENKKECGMKIGSLRSKERDADHWQCRYVCVRVLVYLFLAGSVWRGCAMAVSLLH